MAAAALSWLPKRQKNRLRALWAQCRGYWVERFMSYGPAELADCARSLGLDQGDAVMLHSGFRPECGFRGTAAAVADAFREAIGPAGDLLMVSLPYVTSSADYLDGLTRFDVRKTPSRMGLVSEFFRRRGDVLRSLHPTHPVLASGPRAEWFVAGHERCVHPCGPGSPFDKLAQSRGKVAFFEVPFATFTFFHWLEHRVMDRLHFPLYAPDLRRVRVIDREGRETTVETYVFSTEVIARRRFPILESELRRRRLIRKRRLGNSTLMAVDLENVIDCVDDMTRRGQYFYDMT